MANVLRREGMLQLYIKIEERKNRTAAAQQAALRSTAFSRLRFPPSPNPAQVFL